MTGRWIISRTDLPIGQFVAKAFSPNRVTWTDHMRYARSFITHDAATAYAGSITRTQGVECEALWAH